MVDLDELIYKLKKLSVPKVARLQAMCFTSMHYRAREMPIMQFNLSLHTISVANQLCARLGD